MTENPKLEDKMSSDHLVANYQTGEFGENRKICVVDHVNGLQHSITESDSFVVDMERFSHLIDKDSNPANSRIARNLSRKGSMRTAERKVTSNERDVSMLATSPRATFHGGSSMLEKQTLVPPGPHDHSTTHHQITITSASLATAAAAAEIKGGSRRFSFRRSPSTWTVDPRRMLFFFATLSCMGTIMLIYFTLSMGKQQQAQGERGKF